MGSINYLCFKLVNMVNGFGFCVFLGSLLKIMFVLDILQCLELCIGIIGKVRMILFLIIVSRLILLNLLILIGLYVFGSVLVCLFECIGLK